jgi:type IV secretory pathway VirB4 component
MATNAKATQDFIPIREVRDGFLVLKDGSLRAVLMASSLNFALKSEDEQMAILMQFQHFLNSLDFTVQFMIHSRDLDIRPYIALLEEQYKKQLNELMKIQVREYIEFIKNFTENTKIMTKAFFIIIPYDQSIVQTSGMFKGKKTSKEEDQIMQFEEARSQLEQRMAVVEQGLTRSGVRTVKLGSEELIEMFYRIFNPGDMEKPVSLDQQLG